MVEMEMTSESPIGVGSKGLRVDRFMGTTDESTWEVTQLEENKTIEFNGESEKYIGDQGYELESTDGATRLSYRMGGDVKSFLVKLMMPLMLPMAERQIRNDYRQLKEILESRHSPPL